MDNIKQYGSTEVEKNAEETLICRKIVQTINQYGVNQFQKLKLIYLLALELEDRDHMQEITKLVKQLEESKNNSLIK